jgi:hypothetical protein
METTRGTLAACASGTGGDSGRAGGAAACWAAEEGALRGSVAWGVSWGGRLGPRWCRGKAKATTMELGRPSMVDAAALGGASGGEARKGAESEWGCSGAPHTSGEAGGACGKEEDARCPWRA